jgi:alpha-L-rhamnosidase
MGMMLYQWARDTAAAGRVLGKSDAAAALNQLADNVRDEVNRSFYDATNKTYGAAKEKRGGKLDARHGWHGLMAMAIATGVAPEADVPAILDNCIADMKAHYHSHHAAGHITHQLLYDVFSDHGMIETCYDMMNATGFPSFAYQLQSGNRTIPEGPAWTDKFPAFASAYQNECQEPARWFTEKLCGISPDRSEPGFKHFFLRPKIPARLPSASLRTTTGYGEVESSWQQAGGRVTWTVRVPANSHATAWIPAPNVAAVLESGRPLTAATGCNMQGQGPDGIKCHLGSGTYVFQFPAPVNASSRLSELK